MTYQKMDKNSVYRGLGNKLFYSFSLDDEDISKLPIFQSFGTWDHRLKRKKKRHRTEKEVYRNQMEMEKRLVSVFTAK